MSHHHVVSPQAQVDDLTMRIEVRALSHVPGWWCDLGLSRSDAPSCSSCSEQAPHQGQRLHRLPAAEAVPAAGGGAAAHGGGACPHTPCPLGSPTTTRLPPPRLSPPSRSASPACPANLCPTSSPRHSNTRPSRRLCRLGQSPPRHTMRPWLHLSLRRRTRRTQPSRSRRTARCASSAVRVLWPHQPLALLRRGRAPR